MNFLPFAVTAWLFLIGIYGIVTSRNLIHLIVCLSVVQSSTYVLLLSIGYVAGAGPPVFANVPPGTPAVDPIVQAMALDGYRRRRDGDGIALGHRRSGTQALENARSPARPADGGLR